MKFLSFFTRLPNHQTFNYTPRYYNPLKDKFKERGAKTRDGLKTESEHQIESYTSPIKGSFKRNVHRKRSKNTTKRPNTALIRLGVILMLVLFLMAYLNWGSMVLYGLLLLVPIYIYLKFKQL